MVRVQYGSLVVLAMVSAATAQWYPSGTNYEWDQFSTNGLCMTIGGHTSINTSLVEMKDCSSGSHYFQVAQGWKGNRICAFGGDTSGDSCLMCLTSHEIDSTSSWFDVRACEHEDGELYDRQWFTFGEGKAIIDSSGLCLDGSSETNLTAHTCGPLDQRTPLQTWTRCYEHSWEDGGYTTDCEFPMAPVIKSEASLRCVDVPGGEVANGAVLWMWDCYGGPNQQFGKGYNADFEVLHNSQRGAGVCLDLLGGDTTNGAPLGLWECNGGENQDWGFHPNEGKIYLRSSIVSGAATKCIQAGESNGDNLVIWDCNGEQNQIWAVHKSGLSQLPWHPHKQFLV